MPLMFSTCANASPTSRVDTCITTTRSLNLKPELRQHVWALQAIHLMQPMHTVIYTVRKKNEDVLAETIPASHVLTLYGVV